jgi:hypothetical protein
MKTKFAFIDPGAIMGVVVALIILAVGVFAFYVVIGQLQLQNPRTPPGATTTSGQNDSYYAWLNNTVYNTTNTGNSVFNIIGIVMIIGAIMSIVGLVYNYVR